MPTVIGLIFLTIAIYFAASKPHAFFGLVLFSAMFPATSAINFGSLWIMPYYMLAPIFIAIEARRNIPAFLRVQFPGKNLLIFFGCLAVLSALICPFLFAGTQVYSPRLGSSDQTFYTFPLVFSIGNVAQAAYLILNILVLFAAASASRNRDGRRSLYIALETAFYALTGTIACELLYSLLGIPFPYHLIQNNPEQISQVVYLGRMQRFRGLCGEPSYTGLVLMAFFAAYFYCFYVRHRPPWKALIAVVAIFLVRSSSSIVALGIITILIVILNSPVRFPLNVRLRRTAKLAIILTIAALSLTLPVIQTLLKVWIFDKQGTGSFVHRTTMDLLSYRLLGETYGLGVGLGSYRPSSLLAALLGDVGIVGAITAIALWVRMAKGVPNKYAWVRWALLAALVDMFIAIPDITHPILWSFLALVVYFSTRSDVEIRPSEFPGLALQMQDDLQIQPRPI